MPRPLRPQVAGGVYHVVSRGNRKQPIFCDDADYLRFLELLAAVVSRLGWRCHAYCLMPNHFHLVVETPQPNISTGIQWLNGHYAQWFNRRHGLSGHLFQGRFHGRLVESTYHLLELVRYLALNPVRAGLCQDASGWRWSSYLATIGQSKRTALLTVGWLLNQFGRDPRRARDTFRRFVLDATPRAPSAVTALDATRGQTPV